MEYGIGRVVPVTNLEFYRRRAGVSQGLLGDRIGKTASYVSALERGRRKTEGGELEIIARALGVDSDRLEGLAPEPSKHEPEAAARVSCHVRSARKDAGWTQGKLSSRTGIGEKRLGRIEAGRAEATLEEALAIAEALGLPVEAIFSRRERGPIKGTRGAEAARALVGKRFGSLTVVAPLSAAKVGLPGLHYLCRCDCGRQCRVRADHLKSGHTTSCGCRSGKRRARG